MTREEYEARRMALEQQLQADMALIQAAHATRIRSLERLWRVAEAGEESEIVPSPVAVAPAKPAVAPHPRPESSKPPGVVLEDLDAALPQLPEMFDRRDIDRLLGYRAVRPTLYRALAQLQSEGKVEIVRYSGGGHRTRYRKLS